MLNDSLCPHQGVRLLFLATVYEGQTSYVFCHQPKSFDWRLRGAKPHPIGALSDGQFAQVGECLNQIIRVG